MKTNDIYKCFNVLERDDPSLLRLLYPRPYRHVKGFFDSPRVYAVSACSLLRLTRSGEFDANDTMVAATINAYKLIELKVPTYFIAPDVLDMLLETDPPKDLKLNELKMPVPAFLLVPPEHIGRRLGIDLYCIAVATIEPFMKAKPDFLVNGLPARGYVSDNKEEVLVCHFIIREANGELSDYNFQIATSLSLDIISQYPIIYFDAPRHVLSKNEPLDRAIQELVSNIVLHTLMLFNAEPESVEPKRQLSAAVIHNGRVARPSVWEPNFIGRKYSHIRREAVGGEGTSKSPHIRRSHWHTYRVGPGRAEKRLKWVKWFHVGLKKKGGDQPL